MDCKGKPFKLHLLLQYTLYNLLDTLVNTFSPPSAVMGGLHFQESLLLEASSIACPELLFIYSLHIHGYLCVLPGKSWRAVAKKSCDFEYADLLDPAFPSMLHLTSSHCHTQVSVSFSEISSSTLWCFAFSAVLLGPLPLLLAAMLIHLILVIVLCSDPITLAPPIHPSSLWFRCPNQILKHVFCKRGLKLATEFVKVMLRERERDISYRLTLHILITMHHYCCLVLPWLLSVSIGTITLV